MLELIKLHLNLLRECLDQLGDEAMETKISLKVSDLGIMWESL
jgi:hypothetical protein